MDDQIEDQTVPDRRSEFATLAWLARQVNARLAVSVFLRIVPLVALELIVLWLIKELFVGLYSDEDAAFASAALGFSVAQVAITLFALLLIRLVAGYLLSRQVYRRVLGEQARLTSRLLSTYLMQPFLSTRDHTRSERNQTLFVSAVAMVQQLLFPLIQLGIDLAIAATILVLLLIVEPLATLALIGWLGLCLIALSAITSRANRNVGERRWGSLNAMRTIVDAALGDARLTKLSGGEDRIVERFHEEAQRNAEAVSQEAALSQIPVLGREIVLLSSILVLIAVLTSLGRSAELLVGAITLFAAASVRLFPAIQRLLSTWQKLGSYAPDLRKIDADLSLKTEELPLAKSGKGPLFEKALELRCVSYQYPGERQPTLDTVNLRVEPGDRVCISGPSGAGKSTALLLLCGLLKPSSGAVMVDGIKGDVLEKMRCAKVALVPQDPFIADLSLADNITLPQPCMDDTKGRLEQLLASVGLTHHPDAPAGENGAKLSGGERQRIAILRAVLHNPHLLILDEATSQLDAESEAAVYATLEKECPQATIVAISHKPPKAGFFNRRFCVEQGRIKSIALEEA